MENNTDGHDSILSAVAALFSASRWLSCSQSPTDEEHGLVAGIPLEIGTPGLMVGLAGMDDELLRLAAPERVPAVLLLAPPAGKPTSSPA